MERLYYITIALAAGVIGIALFIIGYRKLVYPKGSGKFSREFWLSTMVIMALLTAVFCSKEEPVRTCYAPVIVKEKSFQDLQKMWQLMTQVSGDWDNNISDISIEEIESLIEQVQKERNLPTAFKLAVKMLITERIKHISQQGMVCYIPNPSESNKMMALEDLEVQYALLEKMSAEGKITLDALNKSKEAIRNNCRQLIRELDTEKAITVVDGLSDDEQDRLVRFIMELSGIDPAQLKDEKTEEPKDEGTK